MKGRDASNGIYTMNVLDFPRNDFHKNHKMALSAVGLSSDTARTDSRDRKAKLFHIPHFLSKAGLLPHLPYPVCSVPLVCWVLREGKWLDTKVGSLDKGAVSHKQHSRVRWGDSCCSDWLAHRMDRFHLHLHTNTKESLVWWSCSSNNSDICSN